MFQYERTGTTTSEERTFASASLYRNYSLLVRRERQLSAMRRIAIAHSRKHESSSPHLAVYCRESVLSESSLRSLQLYVASDSVDVASNQRNPRAADMAVASASNIKGIYTEPLKYWSGRSQRTNFDSMLQCVRTPELWGSFANQHLVGHSTLVWNGADASPTHEVNVQRVRSRGGSMTTIRLAASRSRLQNIKLARK